jgi:hypothetical protein
VHPRRYRVQPFHLQAAAVRLEQTGHQPQQGGLAGTIRPHQPGDETATDVGIQRMQGRATGKGMAQRTQADGDGLTHGHNHACFTVTGMP